MIPAAPSPDFAEQEEPFLTTGWKLLLALMVCVLGAIWASDYFPWRNWLAIGMEFGDSARAHLSFVSENSRWMWVFTPSLAIFIFSASVLLLFDKPPNWMRPPVAVVFLALQVFYLSFRLVATLSLDTPANAVVSIMFFVCEVSINMRIAIANFTNLRVTDRSAQADESERITRAGEYLPTVDVFIPTYSEGVDILERTIIGCQGLDYPNKTVWLLDDMRRPEMRALAETLGCRYLDRPDNLHAKAGNMNAALKHCTGELILSFDADFIPTRDFLLRTVGFFRDPDVAMVQTPQNFYNDDAVIRNLGLENVLQDEQRLFFRALQPGRDASNAIVCHGTSFIVRRSAVDAIGGIPTETITEDWATSIKLQAAGYKLYYLNEALSSGLAADTSGEFIQQRSRWAQGTLQALWASTNPLYVPGLNWKQRTFHFSSILYYMGGVTSFLNLIVPLFFLFGGIAMMRITINEIIFYRLPLTIFYAMLFSWQMLGTRSSFWTEFYDAFLAPSGALTAVRTFINPKSTGFRVTDKSARTTHVTLNRRAAMPFIVLLALHAVGLVALFTSRDSIANIQLAGIVTYFAVMNMVIIWVCILATIDVPHHEKFVRFQHRVPCRITWLGGKADAGPSAPAPADFMGSSFKDFMARVRTLPETEFLSHGDLGIPRKNFTSGLPALPTVASISLPLKGLEDLHAVVTEDDADDVIHFEFDELTIPQKRALVDFLYCRPRMWDHIPDNNELRALFDYSTAAMRMFPLADSR